MGFYCELYVLLYLLNYVSQLENHVNIKDEKCSPVANGGVCVVFDEFCTMHVSDPLKNDKNKTIQT